MYKVITLNANGIRAAMRKGLFEWLLTQQADFICLQETKIQFLPEIKANFALQGYELFHHDALKPGYSGVAIYSKHQPKNVIIGLDNTCIQDEGRHIRLDFDQFSVISLYLPSGSSGDVRQAVKFDVMGYYEAYLKSLVETGREVIICGDWNIVHKQIDIKNWKGNQKNSGCLPEERAWLDKLFNELGWVDAFRVVNQQPEEYTWWSNRGQAWANNVGWRIDYQIVTPNLKPLIKSASVYRDTRFSDHAPLILEYESLSI